MQAENLVGLLRFRPANLHNVPPLLEAAVAHSPVGDHGRVNLGPFGQTDLKRQPGANRHVVVVRRNEHPAFGRSLPVGKQTGDV